MAPSFTVGGLCLVERSDGRVLLVRHVYRPSWGLPGGFLKRFETPADGVRREVREEVGLDVDLVGPPEVVVSASRRQVDVVFRARPAAGVDPAVATPVSAEIAEVRWARLDALPDLQPETAEALVYLARAAGRDLRPPPWPDRDRT